MQDLYLRAERLYFLPIGGTATAPLAGLLQQAGHHVEGVDVQIYPPMSSLLEELEIPVRIGFDPNCIPDTVDRVIVGNAVPRHNPEVAEVLKRRLPYLSQAEAVAHYVLARGFESLVVAGTHGKTTTSAMLAWILENCGADPSYLIGGLPQWNRRGFRLGGGRYLVIEGDEYNAAFFDRGPKFLHYRPHLFLVNPVEFDHADLYPDLDAVVTAFRAGAAQVPRDGTVVVNAWSGCALDAVRDATAPIIRVGPGDDCDFRLVSFTGAADESALELAWSGDNLRMKLSQPGMHNAQNAAMAVAAAISVGIQPADAVGAIGCFPGVARRMEVVGEAAGVVVVDDFAHHPTALAVTIAAARQRWPDRRLVIAFEPRSLTAARIAFQEAYLEALAGADLVLMAPPFRRDRLASNEVVDRESLAAALGAAGVASVMPEEGEDAAASLVGALRFGDVVVGCSSGAFGGFHKNLIEALQTGDKG